MRLPTSNAPSNRFSQFAYDSENPANGVPKAGDRMLNSVVAKEYNKKVPVKMPIRPKRIVESDDEEEEVTNTSVPKVGEQNSKDTDGGWVSARDPKTLTKAERASNVSQAQKERAKHKHKVKLPGPPKKKSKVSNGVEDFVVDDEDDDVVSLSDSDDDDDVDKDNVMDDDEDRKGGASGGSLKKLKKIAKKEGEVKLKSKGVEDADESDDADDGDDDDGADDDEDTYRDGASKGDLQQEARRVLSACERYSANLRSTLKMWAKGEAAPSAAEGAANEPDVMEEEGCLNIIEIRSSSNLPRDTVSEVLTHEDVQMLCPGLLLKPYQLVGVNWLKLLHLNKINGVLADDMGLGKTVQTIAFLGWLRSHAAKAGGRAHGTHLIVVPASTLSNWENELQRFCPSFVVNTYHGSQRERMEMQYSIKRAMDDGDVDVVLSTYTVFERESSKDDRRFLNRLHFSYLVLDEAHCIKNAESSRYTNLSALRAKNRLLLSGTPVQNDLKELLALLSFLMPKTFARGTSDMLMEAFGWDKSTSSSSSSSSGTLGGGGGGVSMQQLRGMLAPFVLRRLKKDVLDQLVDKVTHVVRVEMTPTQRGIYEGILLAYARRRKKVQDKADAEEAALAALDTGKKGKKGKLKSKSSSNVEEAGDASAGREIADVVDLCSPAQKGKGGGKVGGANSKGIDSCAPGKAHDDVSTPSLSMPSLGEGAGEVADMVRELSASEAKHLFTALRKAANHPLLLRIRYQDPVVMNKIAQVAFGEEHFGNQCDLKRVRDEIDKFSDFDLHQMCMEYSHHLGKYELEAEALFDSPKMCKLRTLIPELVSQGHRILVFSQWTRLLDLLEVFLNAMNLRFLRLDGSTPVKERQFLIDEFKEAAAAADTNDPSVVPIPVFLLSTKAGGLGINLTSADTVILHDLDFNPENDRQAEDRCHRIGQTKPVQVYKLVVSGTVDEDIFEMGERKSKLSAAVLADDRASGSPRKGSAKGKDGTGSGKREGGNKGDEGDLDDIGAIGRILSKALQSVQDRL